MKHHGRPDASGCAFLLLGAAFGAVWFLYLFTGLGVIP